MSTSRPNAASVVPAATPIPIQRVQFTAEDFSTNTNRFNVTMNQLIGAVQALQGAGGATDLPSGVNVAGSTVTGLAAPTGPTDAISAGHAQSQYGAGTIGPDLDLGGSHALKGLNSLQIGQNSLNTTVTSQGTSITAIQTTLATGVSGTVTLIKLTGPGSNGSITVTNGIVTGIVPPT